jgi:hypothetical protein
MASLEKIERRQKFSHFDRNSTENEISGALRMSDSMNHQPAIVASVFNQPAI